VVSESWTEENRVSMGCTIQHKLTKASLASCGNGTNALVRLVTKDSKTYFKNLLYKEASEMPWSMHALYSGNDYRSIASWVERYCQCKIANCEHLEYSAGFKFCLLQSSPGNGDLKGGPPSRSHTS
jgi:hypothetical protein